MPIAEWDGFARLFKSNTRACYSGWLMIMLLMWNQENNNEKRPLNIFHQGKNRVWMLTTPAIWWYFVFRVIKSDSLYFKLPRSLCVSVDVRVSVHLVTLITHSHREYLHSTLNAPLCCRCHVDGENWGTFYIGKRNIPSTYLLYIIKKPHTLRTYFERYLCIVSLAFRRCFFSHQIERQTSISL